MSIITRIARSSITGRFVSWWYARSHPRTTVVETTKREDQDRPDGDAEDSG